MTEIASFIVRVYRRDGGRASGVVEDVQTGCVHSFHSPADLWVVLLARPSLEPDQGSSHEKQ